MRFSGAGGGVSVDRFGVECGLGADGVCVGVGGAGGVGGYGVFVVVGGVAFGGAGVAGRGVLIGVGWWGDGDGRPRQRLWSLVGSGGWRLMGGVRRLPVRLMGPGGLRARGWWWWNGWRMRSGWGIRCWRWCAVVRSNQDGASNGLTAPNGPPSSG